MSSKKDNQYPNLRAISKETDSAAERRQRPRLSLASEQFRLAKSGKVYSVLDLSENGFALGLVDSEDVKQFTVGAVVEGVLNLKREKYPLKARVRNLYRDRVGCEFENLTPSIQASISSFLDPQTLGAELKPIPAPDMSNLWYHGPSGTDFLLHRSTDGHYEKMIVYVLGSYVRWEEAGGLSTGRSKVGQGQSEVRGIHRLETLLLQDDGTPDPGKLEIAKKVILSSNLPQDLKSWCIRKLEYHVPV